MVESDEVLKTLGFVFGIYLWLFGIPSLLAPVLRRIPVPGWANPVIIGLWLLLPFLFFLLRYHRRGYEVPFFSRILR